MIDRHQHLYLLTQFYFPRATVTKYHKQWLHTTAIYCLTNLEIRSLKSSCRQVHAPSALCIGEWIFPSLTLASPGDFPAILGIPWLEAAALQTLLLLSRGCFRLVTFLKRTPYWIRAHPKQMWLHFDQTTFEKTLFSNKFTFTSIGA